LLPIFVLPIGWVMLLLAWALIRRRRWPLLAASISLYVCSMPVVGSWLVSSLESRYPPSPIVRFPAVDAIVTLSGIFGPPVPDGVLPNTGDAYERLEAGIILWQQRKADWLVFTGGRIPWENQPEVEGETAKRVAISRGVPVEKILVTREVGNTADEADAVRGVMKERGFSSIALVTSAWHMPRAAQLFRKAGISFVPFPVDFHSGGKNSWTVLDFLPQAFGLRQTEMALREWYGIWFYSLSGH
jgi:uncharacterized SAM-binding protein YcdF (DUF218 family)